jgi:TolA-binding protein
MRGGADRRADFERAMGRYLRGDYAGAAQELRSVVERAPADREARFYLGVSELLAGDPAAAAAALEPVAGSQDDSLRDHARYYLAKAALAQRRGDEARRWLQPLAAGPSEYQASARDLLRTLDALPAPVPPEKEQRRNP